ncbi:MAG TPA: hypothetical protein VM681_00260 [Candidatus Thermoplasmatota archaeon]|nr:hypothetical protein [Candidatus Thermoplasmatota archaeon]
MNARMPVVLCLLGALIAASPLAAAGASPGPQCDALVETNCWYRHEGGWEECSYWVAGRCYAAFNKLQPQ